MAEKSKRGGVIVDLSRDSSALAKYMGIVRLEDGVLMDVTKREAFSAEELERLERGGASKEATPELVSLLREGAGTVREVKGDEEDYEYARKLAMKSSGIIDAADLLRVPRHDSGKGTLRAASESDIKLAAATA